MTRQSRDVAWESAVVVRVPELDRAIGELRRRFDLSLKPNGIAPHVTAIVPFLPAAELTEERELPALRALCAQFERFDVSFARTARFRRVLYLAPEPAEPFVALTRALMATWPQIKPYDRAHKELVPHLTVTTSQPRVFDNVARALEPQLPVNVIIESAQVYLFDGRRWTEHASLPLRVRGERDADERGGALPPISGQGG